MNLQYLFVHMLVCNRACIIEYAQFELKRMLDLPVCDAMTWPTHRHIICVGACMRFCENTSRRLYYLCNNNAAVETRVPTSRPCTNSGLAKEWYMADNRSVHIQPPMLSRVKYVRNFSLCTCL